MKPLAIVLGSFFSISLLGQSNQPLAFSEYGPVAFESFWRPVPLGYADGWMVSTLSRYSSDRSENQYFTQYFQVLAPIGGDSFLQVRTPYHFFKLTEPEANRLMSDQMSGSSWGDIDIVFNIRILRKMVPEKLKLYLSGEMHTAPTNRNSRQFTDTIKLLGTLIGHLQVWQLDGKSIDIAISTGFGGWQEEIVPRQNHILKLSSQLRFSNEFNSGKLSFSIGQTYLSGEQNNDQGWLLRSELAFSPNKSWNVYLAGGRLSYTEEFKKVTSQFESGFNLILPH